MQWQKTVLMCLRREDDVDKMRFTLYNNRVSFGYLVDLSLASPSGITIIQITDNFKIIRLSYYENIPVLQSRF